MAMLKKKRRNILNANHILTNIYHLEMLFMLVGKSVKLLKWTRQMPVGFELVLYVMNQIGEKWFRMGLFASSYFPISRLDFGLLILLYHSLKEYKDLVERVICKI
ncbi:hypothetical protein K501DRAFT_269850 [Backusella circina FSU 941]|nr:hypothetical protein K501DRAFT_269850 [Backusella circina FSU 941]